jgi:hypothetical protein
MFAIQSSYTPISERAANAMATMAAILDDKHDRTEREIAQLQKTLKVTREVAFDVHYLRSRPCWTHELEVKLLTEHAQGKKINIFVWSPCC